MGPPREVAAVGGRRVLALAAWAVGCAAPLAAGVPATETVTERRDDGTVRVTREVRLTEAGDYVNHGVYRAWDAAGELAGQGRYAWGQRTGVWFRWADRDDTPLFSYAPFDAFDGPFVGQATFRDGRLDGTWAVLDAEGRTAAEIGFRRGRRHGVATLWRPDGAIYRRSHFRDGRPHGPVEEAQADGALAVTAEFDAGRRVIVREERRPDGSRRLREELLGPETVVAEADDFWRVRLARFAPRGEELRHGVRRLWHENGQPRSTVRYERGRAIGAASWWWPNGQLAAAGEFRGGVASGTWRWWRENGVPSARGEYAGGRLDGAVARWLPDGRLQGPGDPATIGRGEIGVAARPADPSSQPR